MTQVSYDSKTLPQELVCNCSADNIKVSPEFHSEANVMLKSSATNIKLNRHKTATRQMVIHFSAKGQYFQYESDRFYQLPKKMGFKLFQQMNFRDEHCKFAIEH